jgi:hypothetical protein
MLDIEQKLQKEKNTDYITYMIFDLSIFPRMQNEDLDIDLLTKLSVLRTEEKDLLNKILPEYFVGTKTLKVDLENITLLSNLKLDKISYLP